MINSLLSIFAAGEPCQFDNSIFFNFPHWYDFLDGVRDGNGLCTPSVHALSDVWHIVAAVIEILLRIAAFAAIAMIIYGGISYTMSQGEPEKTGQAKSTLVNALIGLAIAIMASFIIAFLAESIT